MEVPLMETECFILVYMSIHDGVMIITSQCFFFIYKHHIKKNRESQGLEGPVIQQSFPFSVLFILCFLAQISNSFQQLGFDNGGLNILLYVNGLHYRTLVLPIHPEVGFLSIHGILSEGKTDTQKLWVDADTYQVCKSEPSSKDWT